MNVNLQKVIDFFVISMCPIVCVCWVLFPITSLRLFKQAKKICHLPVRACNAFIFASRQAGGLAFVDPNVDADILVLTQAVRILSSSDVHLREIAVAQLSSVVRRTIHADPTDDIIDKFLSGSMEGDLSRSGNSGQASSLWSRARAAARRLKVRVTGSSSGAVQVVSGGRNISAKQVTSALRNDHRNQQAEKLRSLPDQGKAARSLSTDAYANGTSWLTSGSYIRFCDWRFIHRARINCLPTNAAARRWKKDAVTKCRRCSYHLETLPHVLNSCHPNMVPIRRRHNLVQERLVKAIRHGEVYQDQHVPGDPNPRERPDITVVEGNKVTIVDITIPFDNGPEACQTAASAKLTKYSTLRQSLCSRGFDAEVHPFVIGSLGTWFPDNEKTLNRLGVGRRYRPLFRRLCCVDTIKASRDVYVEHITGQRQYQ